MRRLLSSLMLLLMATAVHAQMPRLISYQGALVDPNGLPVPDGSHSVRFSLYQDTISPTAVFSESETITTKRGIFQANIGSATPIPDALQFNRAYYLGVSIDFGAELTPRTLLTAVPYALHALRADSLTVGTTIAASQLTGPAAGDLGGSYPAPTVTKIQGQPVGSTAPTTGQVLQWNGASWIPVTISTTAIAPVAFNIVGFTLQPLTDSVYQKIALTLNNTAGAFDDGGNVSLANSEFTAPSAGDYFFTGVVTLNTQNIAPAGLYLSFSVNGTNAAHQLFYNVATGFPTFQINMPLQLQQGDRVSLQIAPQNPGITTMGANSYGAVRFSGFKIR